MATLHKHMLVIMEGWVHALAQRELKGYIMADLKALDENKSSADIITPNTNTSMETWCEDPFICGVFKKRTLKRRIDLCFEVYQAAVRTVRLVWVHLPFLTNISSLF